MKIRARRFTALPYIISTLKNTPPTDDCIVWPFGTNSKGYGSISIGNGKRDYVHRIACAIANGPIPEGLDVLHSCDNPPCFNPRHLKPGACEDNILDASLKGRMTHRDGEGRNKHTNQLRESIRTTYAHISSPKLALILGIPASSIRNIRNRIYAGPKRKKKVYSPEIVELVTITKRDVSSYILCDQLNMPASSIRNLRNRAREKATA